MRPYEHVKEEVDRITDGLGKPIEEGIKELVISLQMHGLRTEMSCEGHFDSGRGYPWVMVSIQDAVSLSVLVGIQNRPNISRGVRNYNRWIICPSYNLTLMPMDTLRSLTQLRADALDFALHIRRPLFAR